MKKPMKPTLTAIDLQALEAGLTEGHRLAAATHAAPATETIGQIIDRLRFLAEDHTPDGWPAVRMRDITALIAHIDGNHSEDKLDMVGRWYMVNKDGMATLCADQRDAELLSDDAQVMWPHMGPHRAVLLAEAKAPPPYDHGPQAESIAQAARDVGKWLNERPNRPLDLRSVAMLCAHASQAVPQQATAAWIDAAVERPKSGVVVLACYRNSLGNLRRIRAQWIAAKTDEWGGDDGGIGEYDEAADTYWTPEGWYELIDNWNDYMAVAVSQGDVTHWMPLPAGPADGESNV